MKVTKLLRTAVAVMAAACALAMPVNAAAAPVDGGTLYVFDHCPECNNLPHGVAGVGFKDGGYPSYNTSSPADIFFGDADVELDRVEVEGDAALVEVRESFDGSGEKEVYAEAVHEGTTTATVYATDGQSVEAVFNVVNLGDILDELTGVQHYTPIERVEASLPSDVDGTFDLAAMDESARGFWINWSVFDADDASNVAVNEVTVVSSDPAVAQGFTDGWVEVKAVGTATLTVRVKDGLTDSYVESDPMTITVTDSSRVVEEPAVPEPWDEDGSLLPYTIKDGVMTFDGRPDLGEWYRLTIAASDDIDVEVVFGGAPYTMTIPAELLDEDDPLHASEAGSGVYFIRGDGGDATSNFLMHYPDGSALRWAITAGTAEVTRPMGSDMLLVALDAPATLTLSTATTTVVENEQGNSFSHASGMGTNEDGSTYNDDAVWSGLTLVTTWIGDEAAETAGDAVNEAVTGVTAMYVYDIHLKDMMGDEFAIPEGEAVTVTLQIPEELRGKDGLHLFHVADDGTVTDMNATVDALAGTLTFTTTHFSTFVIAQVDTGSTGDGGAGGTGGNVTTPTTPTTPQNDAAESDLPKTGDATVVVLAAAMAGGALALTSGVAAARKRRTR